MKARDIFNPWAAMRQARDEAIRLRGLLIQRRHDIERLQREKSFAIAERDTARETCLEAVPMLEELVAIKERRSRAISQGNRTRAQKRRGTQLPFPNNNTAGAAASDLRTELTG